MCVVSMVGDHYRDKWWPQQPNFPTQPFTSPTIPIDWELLLKKPAPTREEFDVLKKEVEELKSLSKRAKEYDEKNNEPNCEIEDKMKFLREVAKLVGVDLDEVLNNKK